MRGKNLHAAGSLRSGTKLYRGLRGLLPADRNQLPGRFRRPLFFLSTVNDKHREGSRPIRFTPPASPAGTRLHFRSGRDAGLTHAWISMRSGKKWGSPGRRTDSGGAQADGADAGPRYCHRILERYEREGAERTVPLPGVPRIARTPELPAPATGGRDTQQPRYGRAYVVTARAERSIWSSRATMGRSNPIPGRSTASAGSGASRPSVWS